MHSETERQTQLGVEASRGKNKKRNRPTWPVEARLRPNSRRHRPNSAQYGPNRPTWGRPRSTLWRIRLTFGQFRPFGSGQFRQTSSGNWPKLDPFVPKFSTPFSLIGHPEQRNDDNSRTSLCWRTCFIFRVPGFLLFCHVWWRVWEFGIFGVAGLEKPGSARAYSVSERHADRADIRETSRPEGPRCSDLSVEGPIPGEVFGRLCALGLSVSRRLALGLCAARDVPERCSHADSGTRIGFRRQRPNVAHSVAKLLEGATIEGAPSPSIRSRAAQQRAHDETTAPRGRQALMC